MPRTLSQEERERDAIETSSAVKIKECARAAAIQICAEAAAAQREIDSPSDAVFGVDELARVAISADLLQRRSLGDPG